MGLPGYQNGIGSWSGPVVSGILGGIDTAVWDPVTDPWLAVPYGPSDAPPAIVAAKTAGKRAVLDRFGWPDDGAPTNGELALGEFGGK